MRQEPNRISSEDEESIVFGKSTDMDRWRAGSEALMYHRPCPVCGCVQYRPVLSLKDFQYYLDSSVVPKQVTVQQAQCLACFALYLNPCFSDYGLRVLLAEAGQSYGASTNRPQAHVQWLQTRGLLAPGKSVLDVGCYDGKFLSLMPKDVRKVGVDFDDAAIERGRREYGSQRVEFIAGDFESFECHIIPDVVTMYHVLEHLVSPVTVLRKLRSLAHKETQLVLEVPILENGQTNDVNGFFGAIHTTHFSRRSLRNSIERAGWTIVEWDEKNDYNGCSVRAVPGNVAVNMVVDQGDVWRTYDYMSFWFGTLKGIELRLQQAPQVNRWVIWGAGLHTEFLYQLTSLFHANRNCEFLLVDSDIMKHGGAWRGIHVCSPAVLGDKINWGESNLLVSSYGKQEAIVAEACKRGVPRTSIVTLYEAIRIH